MNIRRFSKVLQFFTLSLSSILPITAFSSNYQFDPVHTQILFFVDHLGFSKSHGEFLSFDGSFSFDPENVAASQLNIEIDTASIEMDDRKWNEHMMNQDFFNVEKFPEMLFVSTRVEPVTHNTMKVHGTLTLLGHSEPVTLHVTHNKSGKHPISGLYTAGFSATTRIQRSLFGMTYGLPMLGDEVEVRLEVEGQKVDE